MDLSVITVTWNAREHITEQINSVFKGCKNISCEEIISDNGSQDETIEIAKSVRTGSANSAGRRDLSVHVIENKKNLGFGAANNKGLEIAQGEFILFLNPDMRVEEGSLDIIVDWMKKHPDVGIVSPKLIDQLGKFNWDASPRRFPKVWEQVLLLLKVPHFVPTLLDRYLMKDFNPELEQEVDSVRGSFMLVRRELIDKLGWGFDPRYFFWFEDVDTCRECSKAGYKVMYTPIITCVDYVGQSFKKRKSYWKQKNFSNSMLTYFQKWEPWYTWIWIAIFRPVGMGFAFLVDLFL